MSSVFDVRKGDDLANVNRHKRSARHDRLFRASANAFSCITRPTQRQGTQFQEIALSLYEQVSGETLRYVAALLSNDVNAPKQLVMRLAQEPVSISAPLLLRSPVLQTADFVLLISNGGVPHARTISRRTDLDPTLRDLLAILSRRTDLQSNQPSQADGHIEEPQRERVTSVREQLRATLAANEPGSRTSADAFLEDPLPQHERLVEAALANNPSTFIAELSCQMSVSQNLISELLGAPGYFHLLVMLKSLAFSVGDAFMICAAASSSTLDSKDALRLFAARYRSLDQHAAQDRVSDWRARSNAAGAVDVQPVSVVSGEPDRGFEHAAPRIAMAS